MSCKFTPIHYSGNLHSKHLYSTHIQASKTINDLLNNVKSHIHNRDATIKSKGFLKNEIMNVEVDSMRQVFQDKPVFPRAMLQEEFPRPKAVQCMRPMSAQIRKRQVQKSTECAIPSKQSINSSRLSKVSLRSNKANSLKQTKPILQEKQRFSSYKKAGTKQQKQKKFFSVQADNDADDLETREQIELLRIKKQDQQSQQKRKAFFLKSIQADNDAYIKTRSKFSQSVSRKNFIYGDRGQVIEIGNKTVANQLKKISNSLKNRVQCVSKVQKDTSTRHDGSQFRQNIYVPFKGRDKLKIHSQEDDRFTKQLDNSQNQQNNKFVQTEQKSSTRRQGSTPRANSKKLIVPQGQHQQTMALSKRPQKILFYNSTNAIYHIMGAPSTSEEKGQATKSHTKQQQTKPVPEPNQFRTSLDSTNPDRTKQKENKKIAFVK